MRVGLKYDNAITFGDGQELEEAKAAERKTKKQQKQETKGDRKTK